MNNEQILKSREVSRGTAFDRFMSQGPVRLLLSMIPQGDNPEVVQTLLRDAFDFGHINGEALVMMEVLKQVMQKDRAS